MSVIQPIEGTSDIVIPKNLYGTRAALFFLMREAEKPHAPTPLAKTDKITFLANAVFGTTHSVSFINSEPQKHCKPLPTDVPLMNDEFVFAPTVSS